MPTRRAFLLGLAVPLAGFAKPTRDLQTAALNEASRHALAYTLELPDFICMETVRRSNNVRGSGWRVKDILRVQLGIAEHKEHYKLVTLNGRPTNLSYRSLGGALTEGEWGSLLGEVFRPGAATFRWERQGTAGGRPAYIFSFYVPPENATFHLEFGYRSGEPQSTVVGHKGLEWIDLETQQVTRIEQTAVIPRDFPLKTSKTTVDYTWIDIAGRNWLLPSKASTIMGTRDLVTRNEVEFRDYQKFAADSSVTFEQP